MLELPGSCWYPWYDHLPGTPYPGTRVPGAYWYPASGVLLGAGTFEHGHKKTIVLQQSVMTFTITGSSVTMR